MYFPVFSYSDINLPLHIISRVHTREYCVTSMASTRLTSGCTVQLYILRMLLILLSESPLLGLRMLDHLMPHWFPVREVPCCVYKAMFVYLYQEGAPPPSSYHTKTSHRSCSYDTIMTFRGHSLSSHHDKPLIRKHPVTILLRLDEITR